MSYFPWQSWSPVKPSIIKIPYRDYCPVKTLPTNNNSEETIYKLKSRITGWCSWYAFGRNINSEKILDQAKKIKKLGLDCEYILIDDGWCKHGDWLNVGKNFPDVKSLSAELKSLEYKVGIWISPFFADKDSDVLKAHPDWFIKKSNGKFLRGMQMLPIDRLIRLGRYMIDLRVSEARDYIYKSISTAIELWGASLIKLDFLYAPYFYNALKDEEIPRKILIDLIKYVRNKYPEIYLMSCGCPFEPVKFLVDSIRISKDNSSPWLYKYPLLCKAHTDFASKALKAKFDLLRTNNYDRFYNLDPDVIVTNPKIISPESIKRLKEVVNNTNIVFYGDKF